MATDTMLPFALSGDATTSGDRGHPLVGRDLLAAIVKQSTEKLYLQIAQADQVDRPILIHLPFTPPISGDGK